MFDDEMSERINRSNGCIHGIGNISGKNSQTNHSRRLLLKAKVDPKKHGIIRDSLVLIENKRPDKKDVNLSDWHSLEDRQPGTMIVATSRASKGYKSRTPVIYTIGVEMARP